MRGAVNIQADALMFTVQPTQLEPFLYKNSSSVVKPFVYLESKLHVELVEIKR